MKTTSNILNSSLKKVLIQNSFEEDFFYSKKTYIHPTSIIGQNVKIENNVKIGPFCTIVGNVSIKKNSIIYPNVSIGFPAQHTQVKKSIGQITIGKNCKIREFATIGSPTTETGKTTIGNNCYVMSYSHIAHDVTLEDNVILINNVNLGGHVYIEKNAFLMASCASHQNCRIGQFCALTPFSATRQDLAPFCMFSGLPAQYFGLNTVALKRAGLNSENINSIKHIAKLFFQDKLLLSDIKNLIKKESTLSWTKDKYVKIFIDFIQNSKRGVSRKSKF